MRNHTGKPSIWWIRRDLRLHDNCALREAIALGARVIPLFIRDPAILSSSAHKDASNRQAFLNRGLQSLNEHLCSRGCRLVVQSGDPRQVLTTIVTGTGAAVICAEEDYSPYARRRDAAVAHHLPLKLYPGVSIHHPENIRNQNGKPYSIFTPFSRAWMDLPAPSGYEQIEPPRHIVSPEGIISEPLSNDKGSIRYPAGETEARRRLRAFADDSLRRYGQARDRLDQEGTSALSPYFRFGMISTRETVLVARAAISSAIADPEARRGAEIWLKQLIWREFYMSILYHYPEVLKIAFNPRLRRIRWREDPLGLRRWQEGTTGYPIVDAGMRQLTATGWMHNRARMITASFLVKDLLIDWKNGEQWFLQHLIDGDPAANNGGWQWVAGVGTDAAPYFRIFNPTLQSKQFDPQGNYIRRWIPELERVPDRFIHEPWKMPFAVQAYAECKIAKDYPAPMHDHSLARGRALQAYAEASKAL